MPAQFTRTGNVLTLKFQKSYFHEETFEFVQNKIKTLQYVNVTTPEQVDREITEAEKNTMYKNYRPGRLPDIVNACDEAASCLYTITPDSNFVIDFYPEQPEVLIASPCSGHGFKHSAAGGEVLAELVLEGKSRIDISRFGIDMFNATRL
jgi:sarcosine oxidase